MTYSQLFAPFESVATAEALREMIKLYAWVAQETAVQIQQPYPAIALDQVHEWIEMTLLKESA